LVSFGKPPFACSTVRWRLRIAAYISFLISFAYFLLYAFRFKRDGFLFVKFILSFGLVIMRNVLLYSFADCESSLLINASYGMSPCAAA
jgi:hypothetical protein